MSNPTGSEEPSPEEESLGFKGNDSSAPTPAEDGADEAIQEVYQELRELARKYMGRQRRDHTLQATALTHEAYLRLHRRSAARWRSRTHFFAIAARAMRHILVDHERARLTEKRGAGARKLRLDDVAPFSASPQPDLLDLNSALEKLTAVHPRKAQVVELLYFGGLNAAEAAEVLGVTGRTVERDWHFARVWLHREISEGRGR